MAWGDGFNLCGRFLFFFSTLNVFWGYAVAQLVEALRFKPEGRGFDSRWSHLEFFVDIILQAALWPWV